MSLEHQESKGSADFQTGTKENRKPHKKTTEHHHAQKQTQINTNIQTNKNTVCDAAASNSSNPFATHPPTQPSSTHRFPPRHPPTRPPRLPTAHLPVGKHKDVAVSRVQVPAISFELRSVYTAAPAFFLFLRRTKRNETLSNSQRALRFLPSRKAAQRKSPSTSCPAGVVPSVTMHPCISEGDAATVCTAAHPSNQSQSPFLLQSPPHER